MCSEYWNLIATFRCPVCAADVVDAELQTHWQGEVGSCSNRYPLGAQVAELRGITSAVLGPDGSDEFISGGGTWGSRHPCYKWVDLGARIADGAVVEVWPYRYTALDGTVVQVPA